ncbi:MAG: hypothetical protein HRU29_04150 [Rhizobiales bacterium]|nr:hypothetical protein [Hyphomicrobiales bacterium]NRB13573.1 hypothetical protein [Hyphomicrobiales bacterium]
MFSPTLSNPDIDDKQVDKLREKDAEKRKPNLDRAIVAKIVKKLKIPFIADHEDKDVADQSQFSPLDLLDYIYAVLHSPKYRDTYKEFLKIDFPRIPMPTGKRLFWQMVGLGGQIRQLHLLESDMLNRPITTFPIGGDCMVEKPVFKPHKDGELGDVWINEDQYFGNVPKLAWEFYIGGYQPAQKWLKDRKGRELSVDDIRHYQKMILSMAETHRLMLEIDEVWLW